MTVAGVAQVRAELIGALRGLAAYLEGRCQSGNAKWCPRARRGYQHRPVVPMLFARFNMCSRYV
eukprot:1180660-Pyramimonas_sp.AAC.1